MKAVVFSRYGGPEVLQLVDVDTPAPGPTDILVKVHAAALNPVDWHFVRGAPFPMRMMMGGLRGPKQPRGVGVDYAGTIAAIGSSVTGFAVGQPVFGYGEGALAEYLVRPAATAALKPERLTFEQAAGVPLAGLTALQALRDKAQVRSGQQVLIVGAAGGIGTFAVQIAKALGAHVTGVQSTSALDLVRSLGADRVIDYTKEDFTTGDARYDVVFDNVCNHTLADVRQVVKPGGTIVPNGGGSPDKSVSMLGILRTLAISRFLSHKVAFFVTNPTRTDLQRLADMIQAGTVTPVIDKVYPLTEAAEAFQRLEAGHAHGKIVIRIQVP
jgi:NADPH:quinone reductase-like Zn-dependent oxidoreductase